MKDEFNEGILLLKNERNQEALKYFNSKLATDDPLVYYGIATAKFKIKQHTLTIEELYEIIVLYKKALEKDQKFADAYLMCGLTYGQLASTLTIAYKRDPLNKGDSQINNIKNILQQSKWFIEKAIEINPDFAKNCEHILNKFERRFEGIDSLKKFYENRSQFN
ncbi:hypothetical protein HY498_03020 [Candidatus Woesearchaeota archaeon]|nr:hypothetical protein [Candidatus Woesearchaeota archaeon]